MIAILFLSFTEKSNFKILGFVGYDLIGPFVAIWVCVFCVSHFRNFRLEFFPIPSFVSLYDSLCQKKIRYFLVSYFFFNNGIVCIFAFASMFASFLYNFSEAEILFLGIFINLTGITRFEIKKEISNEKKYREFEVDYKKFYGDLLDIDKIDISYDKNNFI